MGPFENGFRFGGRQFGSYRQSMSGPEEHRRARMRHIAAESTL
jgi:hypothetical protein